MRGRAPAFTSMAWLSLPTNSANFYLNFDLTRSHSDLFNKLFSSPGFGWDGKTIQVGINDNLKTYLGDFANLRVGLQIDARKIVFQSLDRQPNFSGIAKKVVSQKDDLDSFFPENAVFYLEGSSLEKALALDIPELKSGLTGNFSLALFPMGETLGFALIGEVKDVNQLKNSLQQIRNSYTGASQSAFPQYSFDNVTETIKTTTLKLDNKKTLVYGQVADKLVLTGNSESFRQVVKASTHRMGNLAQDRGFVKMKNSLSGGDYFSYLHPNKELLNETYWEALKPFLTLDLKTSLSLLANIDMSVSDMGLVISHDRPLKGVINLKQL